MTSKLECPKGHTYDEKNTMIDKKSGYRRCRRCYNAAMRESYKKRKENIQQTEAWVAPKDKETVVKSDKAEKTAQVYMCGVNVTGWTHDDFLTKYKPALEEVKAALAKKHGSIHDKIKSDTDHENVNSQKAQ